jgi:hypothetical protein
LLAAAQTRTRNTTSVMESTTWSHLVGKALLDMGFAACTRLRLVADQPGLPARDARARDPLLQRCRKDRQPLRHQADAGIRDGAARRLAIALRVRLGRGKLPRGCPSRDAPAGIRSTVRLPHGDPGLRQRCTRTRGWPGVRTRQHRAAQLGGALGLAVLASAAATRTENLDGAGSESVAALNGGYRSAFLLSAIFVALAAVLAAVLLKFDSEGKETSERTPTLPSLPEARGTGHYPDMPADTSTNDHGTPEARG